MRRVSALLAPLLFAAFVSSAVATIALTRGRSLSLTLLCGATSCASFVALAVWVYRHGRLPRSPDANPPRPERAAASADLTLAVSQVVGTVRALLSGFPPGRRQRRWDTFEREFWSFVEGSSNGPRQPPRSRPTD